MSCRIPVRRFLVITLVLIGGLTGLTTGVSAQDATTQAAVSSAPVSPEPFSPATTVSTPATESGPRVAPTLERYQPSLTPAEGTERPALASGGNHTIVISTLALVLITIIVVLLVVD
jgi:hypothetical protein